MKLIRTALLGRRRALAGLAAAAWCLAASLLPGGQAAAAPIGTALVYGDSYSVPTFSGVTNWSKQLADAQVLTITNRSRTGLLASATSGVNSFEGQVRAYLATRPTLPTFTIVYVGTEDLQRGVSVAAINRGYLRGVNRLIEAGANSGTKRLFLVQVHDVTFDPGVTADRRASVVQFNNNVARIARSRPNVRVINLGILFDRVFADPSDFGLTNVTRADPARSSTTALYFDGLHFGRKGHSIIAAEVRKVVARR